MDYNPAIWCIKNNRTASIIFLLIAAYGIYSFFTISRMEDPEFTVKTAVVVTPFPGASPYRVESLVTDKLEKKIQEMPEVEHVYSQSLLNVSIITVDLKENVKDVKASWDRLRNKVSSIQEQLPKGVLPSRVDDEFGDVFGIVIAVSGEGFSYSELEEAAKKAKEKILKIDAVGRFDIYGVQEERIYVDFTPARLAEYGRTPFRISQFLDVQNTIAPSGEAFVGGERIALETTGEFKEIDQLKDATLRIPGMAQGFTIADGAEIHRDYVDPPMPMARFNGKPAVVMAINMAKGENLITLGQEVKDKLKEVEMLLPVGFNFDMMVFQPKFVSRSINEFSLNLFLAVMLVLIVMFIFTGLRTGAIVGTLVPMAMLSCIALLPLFDVTLQRISISALIIALGILLDNGVVVSEDLLVRMSSGNGKFQAIRDSSKNIWLPLLISSLTTIFAFLPIFLAESGVGEYTLSLFVVVTITLLSSWVLSLTLVPFLCYYFLKPEKSIQTFSTPLYQSYRKILIWVLKNRLIFMTCTCFLLIFSLIGFKSIPQIFFPPNVREMFVVNFWEPFGTDIRKTSKDVSKLEKYLLEQEEVDSIGSFIGIGGPRWYLSLRPEQEFPNYAFLIINTNTSDDVPVLIDKIGEKINSYFPDIRFSVKLLENGPSVGAPIQIRIYGEEIETIYAIHDEINEILKDTPGVYNIREDWGEWSKRLLVNVKQEQAKIAGLNSTDIALSLQTQVSGLHATQFREKDKVIPVVVRAKDRQREDISAVEDLSVFSIHGTGNVPLSQVATTELVWQPSNIRRRDAERQMTIKADLKGRYAMDVMKELRPKLDALVKSENWPLGYTLEEGGEVEKSSNAKKSIFEGVPIAAALLILVLMLEFNSIRNVLIILLTFPLVMIGVTPGLYLTNSPFGFMALLGLISLAGIVINNAIMVIDRVEFEKDEGNSLTDAILMGSQRRLRPILSTVMTTIAGLVPLAIQGGEFWRPMANTIIFGLAFATVLSLLVCPVLYSLFHNVNFKDYKWDPKKKV